MTGKRNQGRRQVCLDFGLKASMVLLLGSFVSGCASTEQYGASDIPCPLQYRWRGDAGAAAARPERPLARPDRRGVPRFDVPEQWIRAVMHVESGGRALERQADRQHGRSHRPDAGHALDL